MAAPVDPALSSESPDAALFWAAASPWPDLERVAALIGAADLATVATAAETHRVGPLVLAALRAAGVDVTSRPALDRLRAEAGLRYSQERLLLPRALDLALTPLVDAGMRPTIIKGPALVERYPDRGLRGMDDLDVLLDSADHDAAHELLLGAGWRRAAHRGVNADVPFQHPELPGLPLELHRELETWKRRTSRLRVRELVQAAQPRSVLGVDAFVLPAELELIVLAVHAAKPWHVYNRLIWAVDLAVISATSSIDWAEVRDLTARAGCPTAVAVGTTLATRFGCEVPDDITQLRGRAARAGLLDPLLDRELPIRPPSRRALLSAALADGVGTRARLALGMATAGRQHRGRQVVRVARAGVRWGWRLVRPAPSRTHPPPSRSDDGGRPTT